jgi:hypothetical protein
MISLLCHNLHSPVPILFAGFLFTMQRQMDYSLILTSNQREVREFHKGFGSGIGNIPKT